MASHILWRHHQSVAHRSFQNLVQPHVAIHPLWCRLSTRSVAATKGFWGRSMQCNALWRGFGIKLRVSNGQWLSLIYWHFFEPPLAIHNIVDKTHEWHLHSLRTPLWVLYVLSGTQIWRALAKSNIIWIKRKAGVRALFPTLPLVLSFVFEYKCLTMLWNTKLDITHFIHWDFWDIGIFRFPDFTSFASRWVGEAD